MRNRIKQAKVVPLLQRMGYVSDALPYLASKLANGGIRGVVTIIEQEGGAQYAIHGEVEVRTLAFVGCVLQKWATEGD